MQLEVDEEAATAATYSVEWLEGVARNEVREAFGIERGAGR